MGSSGATWSHTRRGIVYLPMALLAQVWVLVMDATSATISRFAVRADQRIP
jgi:hypothetical protein